MIHLYAEPSPHRQSFRCHGVCGARFHCSRPCIVSVHDPSGCWQELKDTPFCLACVKALKRGLAWTV